MPGGLGSPDQSARIRRLESLVSQYKSELDSQSRDSRDLEEKIAQGQGLVKSSLLTDSQNQIATLESQLQGLEQTLQEVQVANTTLDAEVNDLMRRVASGEYNPKRERVLELQSNPAGRMMAIRNQVLEDLKKENEVLIERLRASGASGAGGAGGEPGGEGSGLIPKESWDRLCKEKRDMEKAHEKRLMRLKEVSLLL
jgi:mitotic spindle assembly checkpoint protein MAD1